MWVQNLSWREAGVHFLVRRHGVNKKEGREGLDEAEWAGKARAFQSNETVAGLRWLTKSAGLLMPTAIYKPKEAGRSLGMLSESLYYDSSFTIFIMILFRIIG